MKTMTYKKLLEHALKNEEAGLPAHHGLQYDSHHDGLYWVNASAVDFSKPERYRLAQLSTTPGAAVEQQAEAWSSVRAALTAVGCNWSQVGLTGEQIAVRWILQHGNASAETWLRFNVKPLPGPWGDPLADVKFKSSGDFTAEQVKNAQVITIKSGDYVLTSDITSEAVHEWVVKAFVAAGGVNADLYARYEDKPKWNKLGLRDCGSVSLGRTIGVPSERQLTLQQLFTATNGIKWPDGATALICNSGHVKFSFRNPVIADKLLATRE